MKLVTLVSIGIALLFTVRYQNYSISFGLVSSASWNKNSDFHHPFRPR